MTKMSKLTKGTLLKKLNQSFVFVCLKCVVSFKSLACILEEKSQRQEQHHYDLLCDPIYIGGNCCITELWSKHGKSCGNKSNTDVQCHGNMVQICMSFKGT